jgi:hypothetical protein
VACTDCALKTTETGACNPEFDVCAYN